MTPEEQQRLARVERQLAEVQQRETDLLAVIFRLMAVIDPDGVVRTVLARPEDSELELSRPALRAMDGGRRGGRRPPQRDRHGLHSVG
ncbi:hypothetical protein [Streptomyces phaeochromogenes]